MHKISVTVPNIRNGIGSEIKIGLYSFDVAVIVDKKGGCLGGDFIFYLSGTAKALKEATNYIIDTLSELDDDI